MSKIPPDSSSDFSVTLVAGEAFGSGAHPSTAMALVWLRALAGRFGDETRILDYGCGSGILAIAAARLGARSVVACDCSQASVDATRMNAKANGVTDRIVVRRAHSPGDRAITLAGFYDIILANILAETLVPMLGAFHRVLMPHGTLIVSGILRSQAGWFEEAVLAAGLTLVERLEEGDWLSLCLRP